eukprot:1117130-Amphidinium_carterae.1
MNHTCAMVGPFGNILKSGKATAHVSHEVKEFDVDDELALPHNSEIVEVDVECIMLPPASEDINVVDVVDVLTVVVDADDVVVLVQLPDTRVIR